MPGAWTYGKGRDLTRLVQAAESPWVWAPRALADSTEAETHFQACYVCRTPLQGQSLFTEL